MKTETTTNELEIREPAIKKPFLTRKKRKIIHDIIIHSVLVIFGSMFIFPFLWMLTTALKTPAELIQGTAVLLPADPQWENFRLAMQTVPFFLYIKNSFVLVIFAVVGTLFSSTLTAYAFAKLEWPGRDILFIIMLATMMIPMQVLLIPTYVMYAKIGWLGTRIPLILPYFLGGGSAFYIFMLRQFFKGIPKDLTESAIVDGASHFKIFINIMLPLTKPALITVTLFTFMFVWNDYFGPLIYLTNPDHWTIALGLRAFQSQYSGRFDLMMAASLLTMIPTLLIFFFAQNSFIEGITFSGIKG
jgi:ABC-type glycerol-3-phosphate transport system permease component